MKIKKPDHYDDLNKVEHSIRSSQAIFQYGVGGMVDFKDQTLMTAAPDFWDERALKQIEDERLANALNVDHFMMPGGDENSTMRFVRFPRYYFCPKCHRLKPLSEWQREYNENASAKTREKDPRMTRHMVCPKCHKDLIVARLVTVCAKGHIDDFPWAKWAHAKNFDGPKPMCGHPVLRFSNSGTSNSGLGSLIVKCTTCNARASLKDAFNPGEFEQLDRTTNERYGFKCSGKHPWAGPKAKTLCLDYPKVMERGSSAVYYPYTISSLVIPPYSDEITDIISSTSAYKTLAGGIKFQIDNLPDDSNKEDIIRSGINNYYETIAAEAHLTPAVVEKVLTRKFLDKSAAAPESLDYKAQEYQAMIGAVSASDNGSFKRESTDIKDYQIPYIKQVALINKIKKVTAQKGFTRVDPIDRTDSGVHTVKHVEIQSKSRDWLPAYEVYGEGIFVEFDQDRLDEWSSNPIIQQRASLLNENYKKAFDKNDREISARFILLHTIAHLLIKQLSFECGYNVASLSERIYCSTNKDNMAGILIYTSDGDSEGTLGGLVRQGRKDTFPRVFRRAIENAVSCSNDPVCSLSGGQGKDSLNLAACYACTLIPETSCEEFNGLLDRGMVVGTHDNREIGLYSKYLFDGKEWTYTESVPKQPERKPVKETEEKKTLAVEFETDMSSMTFKDIFEYCADNTDGSDSDAFLRFAADERFEDLEKPYYGSTFTVNKKREEFDCPLAWKKAKVLLFDNDHYDDYEYSFGSDYTPILVTDDDAADKLINCLKGVK